MKKMVNKIIVFMLVMLAVVIIPHNTEAVLQANKTTQSSPSTKKINIWIKEIRNMETSNQAMGLSEKINETTLKADGDSNNIDVHMIKTTEYGTVAILSASGYGNPNKMYDSTFIEHNSTTGNNSGVIFDLSSSGSGYEWTAGGYIGTTLKAIDERYYDSYTDDKNKTKAGDALGSSTAEHPGCERWHDATNANWPTNTDNYFRRNYSGLFGFFYSSTSSFNCRAVAVCGQGI